ncbi:methyltransferase domain-containing protein [Pelatocladus sp. BLCC-F211]|uniref:class I SAM-dependent methyltransferase n=1 Tax=Pelatocladus sp. BLCC-F211 TaxID=3342752 RepID=UPI0035BADD04
MKKLNLGCGKDIRPGWINLDCVKLPGIDIVHDLTSIPLPFEDNAFDEVLCQDVLEHIEYVPVLREIHRILKPGGKVTIRVPHFSSSDAYADPTHHRYFSIHTFRYFILEDERSYYFDFHFSKIESIKLYFQKRLAYFYNIFLEPIINLNKRMQNYYEKSPLRIFPAWNLEVILIK